MLVLMPYERFNRSVLKRLLLLAACSDGYIGVNCSTPCPDKRYGAGCIETCNCSDSLCHPVYGCKLPTGK